MEPTRRPITDDQEQRRVQDELAADNRSYGHGAPRSTSGAPEGGEALTDKFSADEIFKRVAATADSEFQRSPRKLFFSGIAAGLSLGATFLARSALGGETDSVGGLPGDLLYPIGFVIVVLGGYQLFTENALTPITLVLERLASVPALLRLWGVVLAANLFGAAGVAALLAVPDAMTASTAQVADEIAAHLLAEPLSSLFVRAVIAGFLVASMVWLVHAVREGTARLVIVYGIMLLIPIAGLYHCITSFTEAIYGVLRGEGAVLDALGILLAVSLGNTVGGVGLVAVINYGQSSDGSASGEADQRLGWRAFLLADEMPRDQGDAVAPELEGGGEVGD